MPRWLQIAAALALMLGGAGSLVHVPFYSLQAGPTLDVLDAIDVRGVRTFPSRGKLLLTTASVSSAELSVWGALVAWVDPALSTIPTYVLVPPDRTRQDTDLENEIAIARSKIVGSVAAFRALGHAVEPNGARIFRVVPDSAASGKLRAGDRIVAIDGRRTRSVGAVVRAIRAREPGDAIAVTVARGGSETTFDLTTKRAPDGRPVVGVHLLPSFDLPGDVRIDSQDIVGPSAGLVFALTVVDVFTREDLTGGRTVGVTGTIGLDPDTREGIVGPIGAVAEKVRGAAAAGATVFLVPLIEEAEARAVAPASMEVIGVETLEDAVAALRALPPLDGVAAAASP